MYKERPLIFDFFSKLSLELLFQEEQLSSFISLQSRSWQCSECDLILQGSPHYIIKEHFVRFLSPELSWQTVELAKSCPKHIVYDEYEKIVRDTEDEGVVCVAFDHVPTPKAETVPTLKLVDTTFGFANLSHQNDIAQSEKKRLEELLFSVGFTYKPMGLSSYFCPLDKAKKAVATLIESGWKVFDDKNNEIILSSASYIELSNSSDAFILQGHINFGDETIALSQCIAAYEKNNALLALGQNKSGLLQHEHIEPLGTILQESTLVSDALHLKKNAIGLLQDIIKVAHCSESVQQELSENSTFNDLSSFTGTLRDYQKEGVEWMVNLHKKGLSALLADDMGLGKTVQVLAFLSTISHKLTKALIVVPTSLVHNWKREIQKFLPTHSVCIYHGSDRMLTAADIVITSFALLRNDYQTLNQPHYNCLIVDEAQAIKNRETKLFQALCLIKAQFRLSLTGTPIENSLSELVSHFHFLQPDLLPKGHDALQSPQYIKKKIRPFLLRRKKSDVAKDLPDKIEQTVFVTMSPEEKQCYSQFHHHFTKGLIQKISLDGAAKHKMEVFEAILRLRQLCCHPHLVGQIAETFGNQAAVSSSKCDIVLEDIQTLLSEGKKIVVFSQFTSMLSLLVKSAQARGWPHLLLDGKSHNREQLVDSFQNDPKYPLFFISLKAGGVGLNLTSADYVLLYDPWWNRAQEDQAIDRVHRIGRKETVFAKRYIVEDSIEEKILQLQERKKLLFSHIIEDKDITDDSLLDELVNLLQ